MCGIFAYLNCGVPKTRKEIVEKLLVGLKRLEYRGYDSAGFAVDESDEEGDEDAQKRTRTREKGEERRGRVQRSGEDCQLGSFGEERTFWRRRRGRG